MKYLNRQIPRVRLFDVNKKFNIKLNRVYLLSHSWPSWKTPKSVLVPSSFSMKKFQWGKPILESLDCIFAFKSVMNFLRTVRFLFLLGSYTAQVIPHDFSRFCIIVSITGAILEYFSPGTTPLSDFTCAC